MFNGYIYPWQIAFWIRETQTSNTFTIPIVCAHSPLFMCVFSLLCVCTKHDNDGYHVISDSFANKNDSFVVIIRYIRPIRLYIVRKIKKKRTNGNIYF